MCREKKRERERERERGREGAHSKKQSRWKENGCHDQQCTFLLKHVGSQFKTVGYKLNQMCSSLTAGGRDFWSESEVSVCVLETLAATCSTQQEQQSHTNTFKQLFYFQFLSRSKTQTEKKFF